MTLTATVHARFHGRGHEIRIAEPTRQHVHVDVLGDSGM
jgi:hypothetical protein